VKEVTRGPLLLTEIEIDTANDLVDDMSQRMTKSHHVISQDYFDLYGVANHYDVTYYTQ